MDAVVATTAAGALCVTVQHNWSWKVWNQLITTVDPERTVTTKQTWHKEYWLEHGKNLIAPLCGYERECWRHGTNRCPYFNECWNPTGLRGYNWIASLQWKQGQRLWEIDRSCVDVECISRKTRQGIGAESRETLLGDVCSRSDKSYPPALFNERSMQLDLSTGVVADLETGGNPDTKSPRGKCSSEQRIARPKMLVAKPPCPLFLKLQNSNSVRSTQLESTERTVIPTGTFSYLLCIVVITSSSNIHRTRRPGMNVYSQAHCTIKRIWGSRRLLGFVGEVGKSRDCCDLERKKIGKETGGSVYWTQNEAEASIEAEKSTSKTMADPHAKEKKQLRASDVLAKEDRHFHVPDGNVVKGSWS